MSSKTFRYAGSLKDEGVDGETHGDLGVWPHDLHDALSASDRIVIDELLSFPFESLRPADWTLPMWIRLPSALDTRTLQALFRELLFSRLTPVDRVEVGEASKVKGILSANGWAESQIVAGKRRTEAYGDWQPDRDHKANILFERAILLEHLQPLRQDGLKTIVVGGTDQAHRATFHSLGWLVTDWYQAPVETPFEQPPQGGWMTTTTTEGHDGVVLIDTLRSVNEDLRAQILRQAFAQLKPGGILVTLDHLLRNVGGGANILMPEDLSTLLVAASGGGMMLKDMRSFGTPRSVINESLLQVFYKYGRAGKL